MNYKLVQETFTAVDGKFQGRAYISGWEYPLHEIPENELSKFVLVNVIPENELSKFVSITDEEEEEEEVIYENNKSE